MASLLPIIQEILPMILPGSISVTKATDIAPLPPSPTPEDNGRQPPRVRVLSRDAVVNKTDKMCATVLIVKPRSSTTIRHNGEQEAIIYAVSGTGLLLSSPKDEEDEDEKPERHLIEKGDFAFIPAWTEHQVVNESNDQDLHWVVIRSGPAPVEVDLVNWGGDQLEDPPPQR